MVRSSVMHASHSERTIKITREDIHIASIIPYLSKAFTRSSSTRISRLRLGMDSTPTLAANLQSRRLRPCP